MGESRWIKPAGATRHPRTLVTVIVATRPVGEAPSGKRQTLAWNGAAGTCVRLRSRRWGDREDARLATPADLWAWLAAQARPRDPLWIVCPIASTSLTLAGFWDILTESRATWSGRGDHRPKSDHAPPVDDASTTGIASALRQPVGPGSATHPPIIVSTLITRGKPDIIRYTLDGCSYTWVSGTQYYDSKEDALAHMVGFGWPRSGGSVEPGSVVLRDTADRAELWSRVFTSTFDYWRELDGGPWSNTIGGCASNYFRKRLIPKTLLSHQQERVRELEEAALFGGRASTWFYGPIGSSSASHLPERVPTPSVPVPPIPAGLEHWDVSSMYPTILATQEFPVRYLYSFEQPSINRLREMVDEWFTIASVRLSTVRAEYVKREADRIVYPVGDYDTTLCGPELLAAIDGGEVVACHRATVYRRGRPFADAAGQLINERAKLGRIDQPAREAFLKLLSNAFGGKLAQRNVQWQRLVGVTPELDWGEWIARHPDTRHPTRHRSRAGLVECQVEAGLAVRPLAACFACLTSHGRFLMRLIRESLPDHTVVSQDTDGLWVTPTASEILASWRMPEGYTQFRLRSTKGSTHARFFGPRHYWTIEGWTLSGIHDKSRWSDGLSWVDSCSIVPVRTASGRPPRHVYEVHSIKRLGEIPVDGTVGDDGWVIPYRYRAIPTS